MQNKQYNLNFFQKEIDMLTSDQRKENENRMQEIMSNYDFAHKINWKAEKLMKKSKNNSCLCCGNKVCAMGIFLVHPSKNEQLKIEKNKERIYIYYVCENHIDFEDNSVLFEIEEKIFKDPHTNEFFHIDIDSEQI